MTIIAPFLLQCSGFARSNRNTTSATPRNPPENKRLKTLNVSLNYSILSTVPETGLEGVCKSAGNSLVLTLTNGRHWEAETTLSGLSVVLLAN